MSGPASLKQSIMGLLFPLNWYIQSKTPHFETFLALYIFFTLVLPVPIESILTVHGCKSPLFPYLQSSFIKQFNATKVCVDRSIHNNKYRVLIILTYKYILIVIKFKLRTYRIICYYSSVDKIEFHIATQDFMCRQIRRSCGTTDAYIIEKKVFVLVFVICLQIKGKFELELNLKHMNTCRWNTITHSCFLCRKNNGLL